MAAVRLSNDAEPLPALLLARVRACSRALPLLTLAAAARFIACKNVKCTAVGGVRLRVGVRKKAGKEEGRECACVCVRGEEGGGVGGGGGGGRMCARARARGLFHFSSGILEPRQLLRTNTTNQYHTGREGISTMPTPAPISIAQIN